MSLNLIRGVFGFSLVVIASTAIAMPPSKKAGQWEFSLQLNQQDSLALTGEGGSTLDLDSNTGWGMGIGYNFNEQLNLRLDFINNNPKYKAHHVPTNSNDDPVDISHRMSNDSINLNLTYHFVAGPITPFIEGGIGWAYLDSNVATGSVNANCYWNYWYGYICYTSVNTYQKNDWTYNAAMGVRWEIADYYFIKAAIGQQQLDFGNGYEGLNYGRIEFGWKLGS